MKRFFSFIATIGCCSATVLADPIPLFQNYGVITNAIQIDALAFDNRGTFNINSELPYDMQNVINFTNRNLMISAGGFRFDTIKPPTKRTSVTRVAASSFVNSGTITSDGYFGSFAFGGIGGLIPNGLAGISQSSYILVNATNLNGKNGSFEVGSPGLLSLKGGTTDLTRSALVAGDPFAGTGGGFGGYVRQAGTNYYLLPSDITEIYGGAGSQTNDLTGSFGLILPDIFSPAHRVYFPGGGTNGTLVILPNSSNAKFDGFANISTNGGEKLVQAVFVNTNFVSTNISTQVTFSKNSIVGFNPNTSEPAPVVIVQFTSSSYDPISGGQASNAVSFIDTSALQTNLVMFTNFNARTHVKPSSYEVTTANIPNPGFPGNTTYTPELLYDPAIHASNVVVGFYGGYGVQVGGDSSVLVPNEVNPTNRSPRIEIDSDNLDLTLTRMRSEGPILLQTKHLISEQGADISAGVMQAEIGSTNGLLRIATLFPTNFQRLSGNIYGYSFIWENTETDPVSLVTNNVKYHILIVDQSFSADIQPSIDKLILRSTNIVVENNLKLDRMVRFDAQNLTLNSSIQITNFNLVATNFVGLKNFIVETNGKLAGMNLLSLGFDAPAGITSITNFGQIGAVAAVFRANSFFNSGLIQPGTNAFDGTGSIVVQARNATLAGGVLEAGRLIEISANDFVATNSTMTVGGLDLSSNQIFGRLVINVTNSITDFGVDASNKWQVNDGFELTRKPRVGDLSGTEIRTIALGAREIRHLWAAEDMGSGPDGFFNNAALGSLILDVQSARAKLRFTGTGSHNAIYVRNLNFILDTNIINIDTDLNSLLQIDDNLVIYYMNSNAGDKLNDAFPDRVIQVPAFDFDVGTAPLSVAAYGLGVVTPNLDGKILKIGDDYQIKAKPGRGQVFKRWSGGTNSANAVLTFKMRSHLALRADFVPNPFDNSAAPVSGTYNGLFSDSEHGVQHESSGFITLTVTKGGSFSGRIISGKTFPFRGAFNGEGHASISVRRARQSNLTLDLQIDLSNVTDQVTGTVSGEGWVANLVADRAKAGSNPVAEVGQHTVVIPGGTAPGPMGDGFGTVTVTPAGALRFGGTLADGSRINQRVNLSKEGRWPFYAPLYAGNGSVFSWITFTNDASKSLTGDLLWTKKAGTGRNYRNGFTNTTSAIGSRFTRSNPVVGLAEGTITVSGGNLSESFTNEFVLSSNNAVTITTGPNGLRLRILPSGLFSGSFVSPATSKTISIKGIVLQQQNNARGFFIDADQSGAVHLE